MDQIRQTVSITRATHRSFSAAQWETIAAKLDTWKSSLEEVLKVVENVKSIARAPAKGASSAEGGALDRNGNALGGGAAADAAMDVEK